MKTDVLQVKRTGDFYYPIYFEDNFDGLTLFAKKIWTAAVSALLQIPM